MRRRYMAGTYCVGQGHKLSRVHKGNIRKGTWLVSDKMDGFDGWKAMRGLFTAETRTGNRESLWTCGRPEERKAVENLTANSEATEKT